MISHISSSDEWSTVSARWPVATTSRSGVLNNSVAPCQSQTFGDAEWGDLIADVAAIANSGGGHLDLPVKSNVSPISDIVVMEIVKRLAQFTGSTFDDVQLRKSKAGTPDAWKLEVGPAEFPIGFKRSCDEDESGESSTSARPFVPGAFYFWQHGKRAVATSDDFQAFVERRVNDARLRWSKEIGRVLSRPLTPLRKKRGARRRTKQSHVPSINVQPVRIVNDANAPALQPQHVDQLYPWRQKEIVAELNRRLGRRVVTTYDLQAVRRQHRLDQRPDFVFHLPGAGRRYSPAAAEWMLAQYAAEPEFFQQAHLADQSMLRQRRRKPR